MIMDVDNTIIKLRAKESEVVNTVSYHEASIFFKDIAEKNKELTAEVERLSQLLKENNIDFIQKSLERSK